MDIDRIKQLLAACPPGPYTVSDDDAGDVVVWASGGEWLANVGDWSLHDAPERIAVAQDMDAHLGELFAAAPDLAKQVIELSGEVERVTAERDALREAADRLTRIRLMSMTASDRMVFFEVHLAFVTYMAEALILMMDETKNYWEQDLRAEARIGEVRLIVTTIKPDGLSPHRLRQLAEERLAAVEKERDALKAALAKTTPNAGTVADEPRQEPQATPASVAPEQQA